MEFHNLRKAGDYKVKEWIEDSIPDLTPYQKQKMYDNEMIRWAPFEFYERTKRVKNPFIRLTIILLPPVWVLLFFGLPINFLITGEWGYKTVLISWYNKWLDKIGL